MNLRAKKRLSFLIASSLVLTNFNLAHAEDGHYGWDVDNNSIYVFNEDAIKTNASISDDNKTVEIKSFSQYDKIWSFYGGRGEQKQVEGYTLILNGVRERSDSTFRAYGGHSRDGVANGNTLKIYNDVLADKKNILSYVYGGVSEYKNAEFNSVKIEDSEISGNVYGGVSDRKNANSNTVEIYKTTIAKTVYGGHSASEANALDNDVKIIKSDVKNIYGGYVDGLKNIKIWGASDETNISKNNTVTLVESSAENVYGGRGKIVSENKIFLNNANITNNLAGADNVSQTVSGNELILLGADNYAKNIFNFDTIRFGDNAKLSWTKDATLLKADTFSGENVNLDVSNIALPGDFTEENLGEKMVLLDVSGGVNLSDFVFQNAVFSDADSFDLNNFKNFDIDVNFTPTHSISSEGTTITDTIKGKVDNIVFKNIAWKNSTPLIEKDDNFDYENAAVNTANINFTNVDGLSKNDKMILVENFGNTNNIAGDTYKIKTTLEGKGKAKIDDNKNLIFVIETDAKKNEPKIEMEEVTDDDYNEIVEEIKPKEEVKKEEIQPKEEAVEKEEIVSKDDDKQEIINNETSNKEEIPKKESSPVLKAQEQTHNTVMSMEAAMVALSSAGDFVQTAMEGIADGAKSSADGVATYAGMGGGSSKTKTGSSVNANTWSAILALGQERKLKNGTFSYGGFFEYGRANYTIEPNNGMSGASKYAGGGVFVKWQNLRDVYFEGSVRAGKTQDSASGILTDSSLNRYGYDVSSNYIGAHFGVGKIYKYKNDDELDLYGKFFYTRRGGVSYEAGGFYDLEAVTSKILKIGGRYGKNKVGWNSFIGASYAYEFDGVAKGKADGYAIREAETTGGTIAFEVGLRLIPSATSKWKSDISINAHTGRSKGFGGHVSLAYLF